MKLNREVLSNYLNLEREISRINKKIDYYSNHPLTSSHGVVKGSMSKFPYAECHFVVGAPSVKSTEEREKKIQNLIIQLCNKKREYENLQVDIDLEIENIEDMEIRQIIQMKYIDRMTDNEIGEELGYERSTIGKKIDKYIESL